MRNLLAFLVVAAALWFGPSGTAAAVGSCTMVSSTNYNNCADLGEAFAQAETFPDRPQSSCGSVNIVQNKVVQTGALTASKLAKCGGVPSFPDSYDYTQGSAEAVAECAPGSTWNATTHTCGAPFDSQQCLNHNSEPGFMGVGATTRTGPGSACVGGCDFRPVPASSPNGVVTVSIAGQANSTTSTGKWEFTGDPCAAQSPVKTTSDITTHNDDPQACVPAGNGQTFCLKKDGEHCATASTGKQICWRSTEVGTKTDANVAQTRTTGTNPPTTPPPAPPGDTMNQQTPFTTNTTTTSTTGGTTNNTTTITNYTTASGNDADGGGSQSDCGEAATGASTSPCTTGGASGGADCSTPPISTDPQFQMIATQTWATRCAALAGNSVKVTGDVANCAAPYTVTGVDGGQSPGSVDANAEKLKALRRQICGAYDDVNATPHDGTGENVTAADAVEPGSGSDNEVTFDKTGYGFGSTCPQLPIVEVMGATLDFNMDGLLCKWVSVGGWFVLIITGLWCAKAYSTE